MKARVILTLISMAMVLLSKDANITTPCSVNAKG